MVPPYTHRVFWPQIHFTSLANWGSSWVSKEAKFIKEFDFLGFSHCFSVKIEQNSKIHPKMIQDGWILDVFEDFSILAEKQRLKPKKSNSLMNFASLDSQLDLQVARLVEWNGSGVKKPWVARVWLFKACFAKRAPYELISSIDIPFGRRFTFVEISWMNLGFRI